MALSDRKHDEVEWTHLGDVKTQVNRKQKYLLLDVMDGTNYSSYSKEDTNVVHHDDTDLNDDESHVGAQVTGFEIDLYYSRFHVANGLLLEYSKTRK